MSTTAHTEDRGAKPAPLISPAIESYSLDFRQMDDTHSEFIELVNRLGEATDDSFRNLFRELCFHTEAHFKAEQQLMEESGFPALQEHIADHLRILGQLAHFLIRVEKGKFQMARAYIQQQLPFWFKLHLATMDSALAAHLKQRER